MSSSLWKFREDDTSVATLVEAVGARRWLPSGTTDRQARQEAAIGEEITLADEFVKRRRTRYAAAGNIHSGARGAIAVTANNGARRHACRAPTIVGSSHPTIYRLSVE